MEENRHEELVYKLKLIEKELDLYKLAFELSCEDIKKCPEDSEYQFSGDNIAYIKADRFCNNATEELASDCLACRKNYYLENARFMLERR